MTLQEQYINVPGGQLFVRQWQVEQPVGAPIILVHDSLGSVEQWRDFPAALAQGTQRNVIAYDRLGFGQSSPQTKTIPPSFIDQEASIYLPALTQALGLVSYVLFGHSVGGGMSIVTAAQPLSPCVAVITASAQAFVEELTLQGIQEAKDAFANPDYFARLERWHGERAQWVLDSWTETWKSPVFKDWSLEPYLGQVRCPVLALHGEQDEFGSRAFPERIAQGVVSGRAVLLPYGHVMHREDPQAILALVQEFLQPLA